MRIIKCTAAFCQWNKKGESCTHPNAMPGIMNENPNPVEFCENYRKFSRKARKLKKK